MHTHLIHPGHAPSVNAQLIVMLHGYGSNEWDLYALKEHLPGAYYPVALRGYIDTPFGGYAWYPLYVDASGTFSVNEKEMLQTARKLIEDLNEIRRKFGFSAPLNLLGFSQGSIMSYLLMSLRPELFHQIIAFSGYIHEPVMNDPGADEVKHLRVFASHGIYDDIIPIERAEKVPEWLKKHHIEHTFKVYPSAHNLIPENIKDAMHFLA